jgi:hypothetical protein
LLIWLQKTCCASNFAKIAATLQVKSLFDSNAIMLLCLFAQLNTPSARTQKAYSSFTIILLAKILKMQASAENSASSCEDQDLIAALETEWAAAASFAPEVASERMAAIISALLHLRGSRSQSQPARSTQFTAAAAAKVVTGATPDKLAQLITAFDKPGAYSTVRTDYSGFDVSPQLFPGIAAPCSIAGLDVHVTLPSLKPDSAAAAAAVAQQQLPVVFIFNCYAFGQQCCSWYYCYADRLASWGYAVVQFHSKSALSDAQTEYVVNCLLAWIKSTTAASTTAATSAATAAAAATAAGSSANPVPQFDGALFDLSRRAYIGHSKGGADAAYMLAVTPSDVLATAFLLDGVGNRAHSAERALERAAGTADRSVALVAAEVKSCFNKVWVDDLLHGANVYAPQRVVAATALNTGHFSFVPPDVMSSVRARLSYLRLDTDRPFVTQQQQQHDGSVGIFNECVGMIVAWLEGVFRASAASDWSELYSTPGAKWADCTV